MVPHTYDNRGGYGYIYSEDRTTFCAWAIDFPTVGLNLWEVQGVWNLDQVRDWITGQLLRTYIAVNPAKAEAHFRRTIGLTNLTSQDR